MAERRCRKCGADQDEAPIAMLSSARFTGVEWECRDAAACLLRQRGEDPARNAARSAGHAADAPALHAAAESRWTALREYIRQERAAQDQSAADHAELPGHESQTERAYGAVGALDRLMAAMDRMEADR